MGAISITGHNSAWEIGDTKQISYINGGSGNTIQITNTQTATSDGFKYSFSNGDRVGEMNILKELGTELWKIIQNSDGEGGSLVTSDPVNTYSFTSDYTETHDLGTLTEVPGGTPREFAIEGNGKKFQGGEKQGITVNTNDTLNFNNISEISGWKNYAVKNNGGIVNINQNGGTTVLNSKLAGTGIFNNCSGSILNVEDAGNLAMGTLENSGTVNLKNGTLGGKIIGGTINVADGTVTANAEYLCGEENNVKLDSELILDGGTLSKPINNNGTVKFKGITGPLEVAITGGDMEVDQNLTTNADNIQVNKVIVTDRHTLVLDEGNLNTKVEGAGKLEFVSDMTVSADNIATLGKNQIDNGVVLNVSSGTLGEGVNFAGATDGTMNITGEVAFAGSHTIANDLVFKTGSTFIADAGAAASGAVVSGFHTATVEPGAKLFVSGAEVNTPYKILSGNKNIDVQSWTTNADMDNNFKARYGLKVDTDNTTALGSGLSEFIIQFARDEIALSTCDIPNIIGDLPAQGPLTDWINSMSVAYDDNAVQGDIVNTVANMGSMANIQHSTWQMNNLAMDEVFEYMNTDSRPMARYDESVLEDITYRKNTYKPLGYKAGTVAVGKIKNVQPVRKDNAEKINSYRRHLHVSNCDYSKEVWANYIHSKEKIDGMKTGSLTQQSTLKYDGATVGADLWNTGRGFGGIAVTYADGNNTSVHNISNVHNDIKYYGVNLYNRTDNGLFSIQYDIGYTRSKNDIQMQTPGVEDVKAKAKAQAYSTGFRVETPVTFGSAVRFTPFAGARYTLIKTGNYKNNIGLGYKADDEEIFSIPIGASFMVQFASAAGWKFGVVFEGGIKYNYGDKHGKQGVSCGNLKDGIDFDVADKRHVFTKYGLQAANENCAVELGYRHSKSDKIKDDKYFANVNFEF